MKNKLKISGIIACFAVIGLITACSGAGAGRTGGGNITPPPPPVVTPTSASTTYTWDVDGDEYNLVITESDSKSIITSGTYILTVTLASGGTRVSEGTAVGGSGGIIVFTPAGSGTTFEITITAAGDNVSINIEAGTEIIFNEGPPITIAAEVNETTTPQSGSVFTVSNTAGWNSAINAIRAGGNNRSYVINITGNFNVPGKDGEDSIFGAVTGLSVTIRGNHTLTLTGNGCLLYVIDGQTVILEDTNLRGNRTNDSSLVNLFRGTLVMRGSSSIFDNRGIGTAGGVDVIGGTFIMQDNSRVYNNINDGGTGGGVFVGEAFDGNNDPIPGFFIMRDNASVYGNSATHVVVDEHGSGGGVALWGDSILMMQDNALVSGNTADGAGGGVILMFSPYSDMGGMLIMRGNSSISGNTAEWSGGVHISPHCFFFISGGTVYGSNATTALRNTADHGGAALGFFGDSIVGFGPDGFWNHHSPQFTRVYDGLIENTFRVVNGVLQ
jgi:hypothetical protein